MKFRKQSSVTIYTNQEQYDKELKYWSNATAEFYDAKNGVDITEDELPKELQPLCDYLSENYGMYTYLVQYKDKFGCALVNEYTESTDEGTAKCTNNLKRKARPIISRA